MNKTGNSERITPITTSITTNSNTLNTTQSSLQSTSSSSPSQSPSSPPQPRTPVTLARPSDQSPRTNVLAARTAQDSETALLRPDDDIHLAPPANTTSALKEDDFESSMLLVRAQTGASATSATSGGHSEQVIPGDEGSSLVTASPKRRKNRDPRDLHRDREQDSLDAAYGGRRESLVSNDSGKTSNPGSTPSSRMQRKMMMAHQMSLGLDAEIKAEEAALTPKRRSIFRTSGTASTPDLSTLIRGKSKQQKQAPRDKASKSKPPPASASSSHNTLTTHMSNSTSSLTRSGREHMSSSTSSLTRTRERRHEPPRSEWDPYNSETARQMATIVETVTEPQPNRAPSIDDGAKAMKRGKSKGMFGRMFGSTSSGKEHGPLTSTSQLSLSARSNVEIASPPSHSSPQLPTAAAFPSPQFPGNAQFSFDQTPTNGRPPIPQRPSQPIVPPKESHRSSIASASSHGGQQEMMAETPSRHTRHDSGSSIPASLEPPHALVATMEPPPPPPHPKRSDSRDKSRPVSRKTTAEGEMRPPPARHGASSFTDDVTGLLDRIGHGDPNGIRGQAAQLHDEAEHLQVSPDLANSGRSFSQRTPSPYDERSPSLYRPSMSRGNTGDGQMPEALPVPASDEAADTRSLPEPPETPELESSGPPTPQVKTSPRAQNGEWQRNGSIRASPSQPAIEITSSPNESTPNLPDLEADDERGRRLAAEFIEGDQTHYATDKVAMFLGGPRAVNNAALRYYMQYFDMRNLKLDQAFRELCTKLHLKAESQEIDRIIEAFSARFFDCNPNTVYGSAGVVHTVTGAMLMLNTDLHIADLQKHMSRADFVRNSMRAIQESMPADRESTPDVQANNDSGSLRNLDVASASASQSTTSVRLRAAASRNASGTLSSDLTSPSTQDLRSRASSTTVNSFTYTKAWEAEAENALKEIFNNVRNERILLPIGPLTTERQASGGGFGKGMAGALKRNKQGNSPYGSAMFAHSDGRLSPTPSYANSIGEQQFQPLAPALGFAGNLSHTVIREQEDESHSVNSKETMGSLEELNDDELALLGAPWAKEGLLSRKIQVEAQGKKPQKKDWKQYFVVIQKGNLHMFVFGQGGGSSMGGGVVGGGNWMTNAKSGGEYSLMHAMAMALPKPGYSVARPYCFTVTVPSGEISVFQAGTEELVAEWVATCNYWAARRSRQPLVGGVSNIEYGWTRVLSMDEEDKDDRVSLRSARSNLTRLGAINRVRGQQSQSGNLDKITINDWKPPPHATMPSSLDEEAQLESLCSYVQGLKEELNQHKSIEEPMSRLYSPGSKNAIKARENWTAKSRYIHSEIFKYETYVEALHNAIALRVQRQGEKKLERSLARSTVSLHADLKKTASRATRDSVPGVPAVPTNGAVSPSIPDDGSGYVTADVDETGRAS